MIRGVWRIQDGSINQPGAGGSQGREQKSVQEQAAEWRLLQVQQAAASRRQNVLQLPATPSTSGSVESAGQRHGRRADPASPFASCRVVPTTARLEDVARHHRWG